MAIFEAVKKQNVDEAEKAMKSHMDATRDNINKISKIRENDKNSKIPKMY